MSRVSVKVLRRTVPTLRIHRSTVRRAVAEQPEDVITITDFNRLLNQSGLDAAECRAILKKAVTSGVQPNVITFQLLARHGTFPWPILRTLLHDFGVKPNLVIGAYAIEAASRATEADEILTDLEAAGIYNLEDPFLWHSGAFPRGLIRFLERQRSARPAILAETSATGPLPWPPRVFTAVLRAAVAEGMLEYVLDVVHSLGVASPSPAPLTSDYAAIAAAVAAVAPTQGAFDFDTDPLVILAEHARVHGVALWRSPAFVTTFISRAARVHADNRVHLARHVIAAVEDAPMPAAAWSTLLDGVLAVLAAAPERADVAALAEALAARLDGAVVDVAGPLTDPSLEPATLPYTNVSLVSTLDRALRPEASNELESVYLKRFTSDGPAPWASAAADGTSLMDGGADGARRSAFARGFEETAKMREGSAGGAAGAAGAGGAAASVGGAKGQAGRQRTVVDRAMPVMDSVGMPPFMRRAKGGQLPFGGNYADRLRSAQ